LGCANFLQLTAMFGILTARKIFASTGAPSALDGGDAGTQRFMAHLLIRITHKENREAAKLAKNRTFLREKIL
jgi:hypothetical protein